MRKTFFISGHLDLTQSEFEEHYVPCLQAALDPEGTSQAPHFVVGDARGADLMAQKWLSDNKLSGDCVVTVYHMFVEPRHNVSSFPTIGGYLSDNERDEAMTQTSTHDIAWVRLGRESSGTANNLRRRNSE